MKNKSAGFYASSLEMLLDTMCNMLGGVVFIALMVAVVARDSTPHSTAPAVSTEQLAALTASNNMVEADLQAILKRLQDPKQRPQTNVMRLPNIAKTAKQPWLVILQYGKVYPLDIFSTGENSVPILNRREVLFQQGSRYLEPRPGQGEDASNSIASMVRAFRETSKTNYYFAFLVYNDSFDAFVRARNEVVKRGFQYGWDPLPPHQRLQVGPQGERVLPQD